MLEQLGFFKKILEKQVVMSYTDPKSPEGRAGAWEARPVPGTAGCLQLASLKVLVVFRKGPPAGHSLVQLPWRLGLCKLDLGAGEVQGRAGAGWQGHKFKCPITVIM